MPTHKQGGYNNSRPRRCPIRKMPIQYALKGQLYACVDKPLGSCQFSVITLNGDTRLAAPRGTIQKQGRIRTKDWVLIEPLSSNENGKYQIVFRYTPDQLKVLEKEGHLKKMDDPSQSNQTNEVVDESDHEDDGFAFEGEEQAKEDQMLLINDLFIDDI